MKTQISTPILAMAPLPNPGHNDTPALSPWTPVILILLGLLGFVFIRRWRPGWFEGVSVLPGLAKTSLPSEEVIVRAVQFFATEKFRVSSQSGRVATFDGRPLIPWGMLLLTVLGFMFCIVPGIIMYIMAIRKLRRFQNLVVTVNPISGGTEVSITHPSWAAGTVKRFVGALPTYVAGSAGAPPAPKP